MHRSAGMCASSTGRRTLCRLDRTPASTGRVRFRSSKYSRRHPGGAVGTPQGVAPRCGGCRDRRSALGQFMSGTPTTPARWTGCCGSGTRHLTHRKTARAPPPLPARSRLQGGDGPAGTLPRHDFSALTGLLRWADDPSDPGLCPRKNRLATGKKRATPGAKEQRRMAGGGPVLLSAHHPFMSSSRREGP